MKATERISNKLNELLVKNYDAEKGYLNAAESVESPDLKLFFKRRAFERSEFANELRKEILRYDEHPKDSGSFKGVVYRNWVSLKNLFTSNNEEAILEEVIKGEERNLEEYLEVLEDRVLPSSIVTLLLNQKNAIQNAIDASKKKEILVT
ncbi:PA2169 family four-helix-bundle protein [Tamlana fucoidanivorans]|uniref:PA2169 family four-helix-bundle protein n=1 Tax=Allotamlana fucoidanivorans TaxID=2583814 RepID=A0A5C4SNB2_9FLAO|nr:PA2169 family four-helix-bundle protein [Tamlana fucoidanivorans]TNJ45288.1 PA2169 family four-helix-bundle protein [Tamlana fucoidanivorans]